MAGPLDMALKAVGSTLKGARSALNAAPFTTLGTTAVLAPEIANFGKRLGTDQTDREIKNLSSERETKFLDALKARRLQQVMGENQARLAAFDPHTYYEVLAGRRLPIGAVVFGGAPRTDLMEQLAYGMATGKYRPPPSDDELMNLL